MKRLLIITIGSTLAAIAWGIATRGCLAYGGEMILPALALAYAVITQEEEEDEKESRP